MTFHLNKWSFLSVILNKSIPTKVVRDHSVLPFYVLDMIKYTSTNSIPLIQVVIMLDGRQLLWVRKICKPTASWSKNIRMIWLCNKDLTLESRVWLRLWTLPLLLPRKSRFWSSARTNLMRSREKCCLKRKLRNYWRKINSI